MKIDIPLTKGQIKYINDELICPKCGSYMKEWILHWRCRKLSCKYGINKSELQKMEKNI